MSDLEEKGFLFHPHTSAGRIPTNKAYRVYVDSLMRVAPITAAETDRLAEDLARERAARRSRQFFVAPRRRSRRADAGARRRAWAAARSVVLRRLELVRVSAERLLMVLTLERGVMRTVFVEVGERIADVALAEVSAVLNERLAG